MPENSIPQCGFAFACMENKQRGNTVTPFPDLLLRLPVHELQHEEDAGDHADDQADGRDDEPQDTHCTSAVVPDVREPVGGRLRANHLKQVANGRRCWWALCVGKRKHVSFV